ncbi:MAG TPA: AarF/ABC1/UbiB kinase family protein [Dermatophilaceae bacterium]|nr:AarF/ABC1/UbiB kinase family protein [Dermatophilaceae bacterium]
MKLPLGGGDAGRYADLARLLVKHGRGDLVSGAGLDEFLVEEGAVEGEAGLDDGSEARAQALTADLERMGPTYVKLGQLLSTRYDLLPPVYTTALQRLQDSVEEFPFEQVKEIVESEIGAQLRHLFTSFDEEPIGSASIGQVHRAVTRSGREVVVKVQRPGIRETVRDDMEALTRLTELADKHTDLGRRYGFGRLLAHFRRSLAGELDYRREAANLVRFGELAAAYEHLVVPQPLPDYCTSRVLTMDYVPGKKVTDVTKLGLTSIDARPLVEELFRFYLHTILVEGVLHADPHPGNILLTDDSRLALLDLGMVATVSPRIQDRIVKLLLAISDGDGEEAALVLAGMGHPLDTYDAAAFRDDVSHLVSSTVAMGSDLQAGGVLVELSRLSGVHGLRPPAEMSMVGKALLNLDQATVHLDPSFAPAEAIRANVADIMRGGLAVSAGGVIASAIEAKEFASQLPRRANRIMDALADGELTFRVNAIDEERALVVAQRLVNRVTIGIVLAATIVGAALMMQVPTTAKILDYPAIAMVFFVIAAIGGAALVIWVALTDRKVARESRDGRRRKA